MNSSYGLDMFHATDNPLTKYVAAIQVLHNLKPAGDGKFSSCYLLATPNLFLLSKLVPCSFPILVWMVSKLRVLVLLSVVCIMVRSFILADR